MILTTNPAQVREDRYREWIPTLTGKDKTTDNSREIVRGKFQKVADGILAHFLTSKRRPGCYRIEVHHDTDGLKLIEVSHTENLDKVTL